MISFNFAVECKSHLPHTTFLLKVSVMVMVLSGPRRELNFVHPAFVSQKKHVSGPLYKIQVFVFRSTVFHRECF